MGLFHKTLQDAEDNLAQGNLDAAYNILINHNTIDLKTVSAKTTFRNLTINLYNYVEIMDSITKVSWFRMGKDDKAKFLAPKIQKLKNLLEEIKENIQKLHKDELIILKLAD